MLGLLGNKETHTNKISKEIDNKLLPVLDCSILKINSLLENKDGIQERLKFSQAKEVQKEIRILINKGKELYSQAKTKEEKERVIEHILMSMDYLFAEINAKRVFVLYPKVSNEEFFEEDIESQIMRLMLPKEYDMRKLDSVSGGNCYMFGIGFYFKVLNEIIGEDKDISFKFHLDSHNNHGTFSINDKILIDSNIRQFSCNTGKSLKNTNFYLKNQEEYLQDLLSKLGVFENFDNAQELLKFVKTLPIINTSNYFVRGKNLLKFAVSKKGNILYIMLLTNNKSRLIYIYIKEKDSKKGLVTNETIEHYIINNIASSDYEEQILYSIFSKLDKNILRLIFEGLGNQRIKVIPGLLCKILKNEKIFFTFKRIYNSFKR